MSLRSSWDLVSNELFARARADLGIPNVMLHVRGTRFNFLQYHRLRPIPEECISRWRLYYELTIGRRSERSISVHLLMPTSQVIYSAQSTLAFWAVNYAQGMANNAMTDEQRAALSPDSAEYEAR